MSENKLPSLIDKHVGRRIRWRRRELRLSQTEAGKLLGITFQQFQKYETGTNRVSAGRLYEIAARFEVPVGYFYQGVDAVGDLASIGVPEDESEELTGMIDAQTIELVTSFRAIPEKRLQRSIVDMVRANAEAFGRHAPKD